MTRRLTFDEFRATGEDCDDVGAATGDETAVGCPGRVYCGRRLWIERFPDDHGTWCLRIGNREWEMYRLLDLEERLYEHALATGHCDVEDAS